MANRPIVSICIPTFNRAEWLRDAITSCLRQEEEKIEVVVSDNASEDNTEAVVREFTDSRIRYRRLPSPVPPLENWNSSWQASCGEFVTFLCDDDLLLPDFVATLCDLAERSPEAALFRSGLRAINESGDTLWESTGIPEVESPQDFLEQRVRFGRLQFLPGFLCRRADIEAVGGVLPVALPKMLYIDDYLWFRIAFRGSLVVGVGKPLWCYRQHHLQYGGNVQLDLDEFAQGVPHYVDLLVELARQNGCSAALTSFLAHEYGPEMLRARIGFELRRARSRSLTTYLARLPACLRLGRAHGLDALSLMRSGW